MRYTTNLNIIVKAIEKATAHILRDFSEIEILQTNPVSSVKFANACYNKIKKNLIEDLTQIRPDYNLIFADGQKIIVNEEAEYSFVIFPIDGLGNLSRGIADFTCAIALRHNNGETSETISLAILKPISNDLYYCEKGYGAFLNNRKIRVSRRKNDENLLAICDDTSFVDTVKSDFDLKNIATRNYGCKTLEIGQFASAHFDLLLFAENNYDFIKIFELLITEAGGRLMKDEKFVIISNDVIKFI